MPVIDGLKLSCQVCLRGHRSAVCDHVGRELFPVRPKGRPPGSRAAGGKAGTDLTATNKKRKVAVKKEQCDELQRRNDQITSQQEDMLAVDLPSDAISPPSRMSVHALIAHQSMDPFAPSNGEKRKRSHDTGVISSPNSSASPVIDDEDGDKMPSDTPQAPPFDLALPCTCPDPCPCPGCPGKHRGRDGGPEAPSKAGSQSAAESAPTPEHPSSHQSHPALKPCCTKDSVRVATPPSSDDKADTSDVCGSCLPCIIAPYEREEGIMRSDPDTTTTTMSAVGPAKNKICCA